MFLLAACGPDALAWRADAVSLAVSPETLTFPATPVGATARMPVAVTNQGKVATSLEVRVPAPFTADRATVELGAGATVAFEVGFAPTTWTDAEAVLELLGQPGATVALVGPVETDADGDGADAPGAGGADCDDADASVYPGAFDLCGDTVDADCDPTGDDDCDGDGVPLDEDCDDGDADAHPGAVEVGPDGRDEDCDGRIDEVLAVSGELLVTELAPQAPSWIEVCNVSTRAIVLDGFTVSTTTMTGSLPPGTVEPGACAAICASTVSGCAFELPVTLAPTSDTVTLSVEGLPLDTVVIDATWDWEPGWVWSLDPRFVTPEANDLPDAWCWSIGSPGAPNPSCP